MRWVSAFFALALTGALQANALDATIFTFSPKITSPLTASAQQQTLSEDEARLVLELRLKSSVATVLGMVDADTVNHLNQFAQDDLALFGGATGGAAPKKSILILEGIDQEVALVMQKAQPTHIYIPQISSPFVGVDLVESFVESSPTAKGHRGQICTYFNDASRAASSTSQSPKECLSRDPMFADGSDLLFRDSLTLVDSVEFWLCKDYNDSAVKLSFKNASGNSLLRNKLLERLLLHLAQISSTNNREITTVVLPPGVKPERISRRGAMQSSTPVTQQNTFRRSTQNFALRSTLAPVCHASNSSCAESTNDCSGHGSCYLKYGSGVEGTTGNCYACQCKQSFVQNSDGTTITVQWGGSACQKTDISSPFFLVAGVSLFAIALAGCAIGMLFSMGSQELPSVISAGVGGPKSQI
ncbi:putative endoplasmic reticulum membrane protein [Penicillium digitatum]|uniref:Vacuolar sorting protein Vps3844 C-terminal domain-containing protein n=3 Tax=Penicillium digitatum TaxID=36651 RepID=K9F939_PEND2|nr:hypothetical protein PDIP_85630 [Penicillium digitatum Pd1]EKV04970.1 hypothetical protein PDIP_85630 [Penicillium digitatum Pd1]EKV05664.1 hypothetical protein PDIG_82060 [Penicillium digitatum PHI26]QQK45512.1 putative endoplasmic reticulum membrane protein [Penicillium digitatum]